MRRLFLLVALLAAPAAYAVDLNITCTPPTRYSDSTTIPSGTAITFKLYGGKGTETPRLLDTKTACAFLRTNVETGVLLSYYVTATAGGLESAASATVTRTVAPPPPPDRDGDGVPDATDACPDTAGTLANGCNPAPPQPPANVTITTVTAYEYRPSTNTFVDVGLVPAGVTCGPETKTLGAATYCRVALKDADLIIRPANKKLAEVWVRA